MNSDTSCDKFRYNALLSALCVLLTVASGCDGGGKFVCNTSVMAPTINAGEIVLTKQFRSNANTLRRYDLVVFSAPDNPKRVWVMRILALPGETLAMTTNELRIDHMTVPKSSLPPVLRDQPWFAPSPVPEGGGQREWLVGSNETFVVGDNLVVANDSRNWGPLKLSMIKGIVRNVRARGAIIP